METDFQSRRSLVGGMLAFLLGSWLAAVAAEVPPHAQGLNEQLLSVQLADGVKQEGVLSVGDGATAPTHLAVLIPGNPSVLRPVVAGTSMVRSQLTGNFLVRARRHLASESLAILLVDCRTDQQTICSGAYQASKARYEDVGKLIAAARAQLPSIRQVWLVGTSFGTITSAYLPTHATAGELAGVLHTATMSDPYRSPLARELIGFDYRRVPVPQAFVHHKDDPCPSTPHHRVDALARQAGVTLVTVTGAASLSGEPCQARTQHGFAGVERAVMAEMRRMILEGVGRSRTLAAEPD